MILLWRFLELLRADRFPYGVPLEADKIGVVSVFLFMDERSALTPDDVPNPQKKLK